MANNPDKTPAERIAQTVPVALLVAASTSNLPGFSSVVRLACEARLGVEWAVLARAEGHGTIPPYLLRAEIVAALGAGMSREEIAFCLDLLPDEVERIRKGQ